jgi:hypothetical protein
MIIFESLFRSEYRCLRQLGSIPPTYLRTASTPIAPKSVRIQSSWKYLFTLLGSTGTKAACRMLMKLTPGAVEVLSKGVRGEGLGRGPR